jgi:hypothetical protein
VPPPRLVLVALVVVMVTGCSDDSDQPEVVGSKHAFCAELRAAVQQSLTVFDPVDPVTPGETTEELARLADAAPPALADDVRLLADAFAGVSEVLAEIDPSDPEAADRLAELDLDQDAIASAQEAVTAYARDDCGINLQAINDASVPTTAPPATLPPTTTVPPTTVLPTTVPPTTVPPTTVPA